MKAWLTRHGRTFALLGVLLPLLVVFAWVGLRSGPLAAVPVTVVTVEVQPITPSLFGIGTVEARYTHRIGPIFAGRLARVGVQPGDRVRAGQLLGEMDPVDLDDRIAAQTAAAQRADAAIGAAAAQVEEAGVRKAFAGTQAKRYDDLLALRGVSEEARDSRRQELQVAQAGWAAARANLEVARQEAARLRAERQGLRRQRTSLQLVAPVDGLVTRRDADPGTTVVAGQAVVDIVEPASLWLNVRFDQQRALGLAAGLAAQVVLRSQGGAALAARIARIEPLADAVTEEVLAKVEFERVPASLPPIGELVEVTVALAPRPALPVVPSTGVQRHAGRLGVWLVDGSRLRFQPVRIGADDLDGRVEVLEGLSGGERVVSHSLKALRPDSRIEVVDRLVAQR